MNTKSFLASVGIVLLAISTVPAADSPAPGGGPAARAAKDTPYRNVGPEKFDQLRTNANHVVLDVRTKKEFESGHIPGAVNIDWYGPDFAKQVSKLDPGKTYLVHCAGGIRSGKACHAMSGLKFTNLFNLEAGFKSWEKAGKPVQK